jgi:putative ABC transport system permease protein
VLAGTVCLVLAGLVTAVVVETIFYRRQRLGEVLRLGEES